MWNELGMETLPFVVQNTVGAGFFESLVGTEYVFPELLGYISKSNS